VETGNPHVFGYVRQGEGQRVLALANLSEHPQTVAANVIRTHGLSYAFRDLAAPRLDQSLPLYVATDDFVLEPYGFVWLAAK
jgi:amylosucrase